jgi:hypothetical protein
MPAVIFPDGARLVGKTWADLELQLRKDAWNPSFEEKFRKEFANRARNWSGTEIATESSSKQFFEDLERAGMVLVEREDG